jgi:hypothetical protein
MIPILQKKVETAIINHKINRNLTTENLILQILALCWNVSLLNLNVEILTRSISVGDCIRGQGL